MLQILQRLVLASLVMASFSAAASDSAAALDKLKTAYLYNFAKFVSWPDEPEQVVLCVATRASTSDSISALNGRRIDEARTLVVRDVGAGLSTCHMYFGATRPAASNTTVSSALAVASKPDHVLMISDEVNALESGFAFQFFLDAKKLRFAVNSVELERAGYKISSKLLQLARPLS